MVMAEAGADLPAIMVTGGPMLNGKFRETDVGAGTHVWKFEQELAAGRMTQAECVIAESGMARSCGHCMTMGTASTMACMAESLGMQLPGSAGRPRADSRRLLTAQLARQRVFEPAAEGTRPS